MGLATAIFSLQTNDGIVSGIIGDRAYLAKLPESPTYPCTRHFLVSDVPEGISHSGEVNVYRARWQIDAYSQEYDDGDFLVAALLRLFVPLNKRQSADVIITSCKRRARREFHESALDKWRFILEFEFLYSQINMP